MNKLRFTRPLDTDHTIDIDRIVRVCLANDYEISRLDAQLAWEAYSEESYAAGWITLPERDEDLLDAIYSHTCEELED